MNCAVVKIFWERVLLHLELEAQNCGGGFRAFLEEENSGRRFALRLPDGGTEAAGGRATFYINVTNPGTCRCLPDGIYRVVALAGGGTAVRVSAACDAQEAEREFRFNGGKDCCRYSMSSTPLSIQVKTEYTRQRHPQRAALSRNAVAALYRTQWALSRASGKDRRRKRVLFLSGQSQTPGPNLTAVRDRMRERGMTGKDGGFEILESYRDRGSGRGSRLKALRMIAMADYIFLDDHEPLFDSLILNPDTVLTQLWHGGVGFKSSGYSRWGHPGCPAPFNCHRQYTWGVVSSRAVIPIFSEIWGINDDQVLPLGLPKMDRFQDPAHREKAEKELREAFPLIRGKKVLLFAPTYRGRGKKDAAYPFDRIDFDLLYETLGEDAVALFRMHPWVRDEVPIPPRMRSRMADAGHVPDINDLFYVTDVLITDYSSNICEFSLMDRPMLFYGFDEEEYARERGFHRPYREFAPGRVCHSFPELMEAYRTGDFEQEKAQRYVREQFDYRDSGASDRVIDRILLGK